MLYTVLLFAHSWWRWIVLAALLVVLVRALRGGVEPWGTQDKRWMRVLVSTVDMQLLVGLALLFLSPVTRAAFASMGAAMKDPVLRFFAVEHTTAMILAVASIHVGAVRARKAVTGATARKRVLMHLFIALILVLAAIPWPGFQYGRPLFRY
ncbi:MAG: hypothetical protein H7Z43_10085 [Clostridia bacterium]|nr:hypothetical protein [Deltaproteobacteria bacterium]